MDVLHVVVSVMSEHPFISYAQNNEDVLLWRALKDIRKGFYIDVGAQSPVEFSVTKAFYDRGWHGINIEPVSHWFEQLVHERPHDINLNLALSNKPEIMKLFEVEGTGLSTTEPEFARRHSASGFAVSERVVECTTLDQVCADNDVKTVHFLKVDCEGAEKSVLEGFSCAAVRPWIILVEATEPLSTKATWRDWEYLLTDHEYRFVFFDGLNRYYLADEHMDLSAAFDAPVNVFDNVQRISDVDAQQQINHLEEEIEALKAAATVARLQAELTAVTTERDSIQADRDSVVAERDAVLADRDMIKAERDAVMAERDMAKAERDAAIAECEDLKGRQAAFLASHSWRVTAPLRGCSRACRWVLRCLYRMVYLVVRPFAHMARPLLRWLARSSRIRWMVIRVFGEQSRITKGLRLFLSVGAHRGFTSDGRLDVDNVMKCVRMEIEQSSRQK